MNIRLNKHTEINRLVEIWYVCSVLAHDFIDQKYWESQQTEMKEKYIPMSETYIISNENKVVGFVSMMDNYLAALFIDVQFQGEGYGKGLLDFIKGKRGNMQLKVYKRNKGAVDFYLKNDFVIKEAKLDEQTSEEEYVMIWEKN